ncbi:MAG: hypothetical protein UY01_C0011G0008 [Candidatus Nomurabacteria bacterium GW2011_GWB1_47_6]|uniref:Uncharacterized protein n=1 Tax=Candidatus Nomurabacteria bacterium GW2011_GWB1_47_6 TaxID=1618749 RepID=A0A0G1T0Z8_9BACT|nr:MAG: hypothetical protein UY01_C0011G0008 [Candidatus Nomurabacteria bacterium GW2011_GWB1_47_6]
MKYELLHISSGFCKSKKCLLCFSIRHRECPKDTKPCRRAERGGVAEWLKAPVSKTGIGANQS